MKELIFEPGASSLLLYYTFAGVTIACYTGFIYKLINRSYKKSEGESEEEYEKSLKFHTGLVFIALGISQSLTGFIMNRVGDKFNKYKMASRMCNHLFLPMLFLRIISSLLCCIYSLGRILGLSSIKHRSFNFI